MTVRIFAPAKINLALHITGQRADGYHLIDTLVGFGPAGDTLSITDADGWSLTVQGPQKKGVPTDATNLVLKSAALFGASPGGHILLDKHLPAAAGIGGGSADAAAVIRWILARSGGNPATGGFAETAQINMHDIVALGADTWMCLDPIPTRARGIGQVLDTVAGFPDLPAVIVNPNVPLATADVFARLDMKTNDPLPDPLPSNASIGEVCDWLRRCRNDLQPPALDLQPAIGDVLTALERSDGVQLARMSGSGATCFAIYETLAQAEAVSEKMRKDHPDWWIANGTIGDKATEAAPVL